MLGIQTYVTFRLNDRFTQLLGPVNHAENQIKLPDLSRPTLPKSAIEDDFFKDRSWNPYEGMQHMQAEMDQMSGKSFSRFHMHNPLGNLLVVHFEFNFFQAIKNPPKRTLCSADHYRESANILC